MFKKFFFSFFILFFIIFANQPMISDSPNTDQINIPLMLNFQGKLTDNIGNPVRDSFYSITFRLYTTPTGGTAFWGETKTIETRSGLFHTLLGSVVPITYLPLDGNCYLEMQVNPNPAMSPRIRIVSSAYSYIAKRADTANYAQNASIQRPITPPISTNEIDDNTITSAKILDGTITRSDVANNFKAPYTDTADYVRYVPASVDSARVAGNAHKLQGKDTSYFAPANHTHPYVDSAGGSNRVGGLNLAGLDSRFINENQVAGGDLTGNYPNPTIANNAVTSAKILDGTIVGGDLNQMGATTGQVLKWTGTTWAPSNDEIGGDNAWVRGTPDSVLYTIRKLGIARGGSENMLWGNVRYTHINLGIACTTGYSGGNYEFVTVCGGYRNKAGTSFSTVGGGSYNTAWFNGSTVSGGVGNEAGIMGIYATVGGGRGNAAYGYFSTISGGDSNYTTDGATVGGGRKNWASEGGAVIGGGYYNRASDYLATVGGGYGDTASGEYATVSGGYINTASGEGAAVGGGKNNKAIDTCAIVGGGYYNIASNRYATVGGGYGDTASGRYATVGGGRFNKANGQEATVGGGFKNTASGNYATVCGGSLNTASGNYSTIAGGYADTSAGSFSFTTNDHSVVPSSYFNSSAFNGQTATASNQLRCGTLSQGGGAFTIDHPLDPYNRILNHYFVEGPEMLNIYRGFVILDVNGKAEVKLPDYFSALNRNPHIQLTGVGTSDVYVLEDVKDNRFVIGGKPGTKVYWLVTGERQDVSAEVIRRLMPVEQEKIGELKDRMLDDEFLSGCMEQLEKEGKAIGVNFRTAEGRKRYEDMKRAPKELEKEIEKMRRKDE